jgi:hypothetical protein
MVQEALDVAPCRVALLASGGEAAYAARALVEGIDPWN